jgi:hypothetical protein
VLDIVMGTSEFGVVFFKVDVEGGKVVVAVGEHLHVGDSEVFVGLVGVHEGGDEAEQVALPLVDLEYYLVGVPPQLVFHLRVQRCLPVLVSQGTYLSGHQAFQTSDCFVLDRIGASQA